MQVDNEQSQLRIGVLALQGAFEEHIKRLRGLCVEAVEVRTVAELAQVDGLIIPGGESTTMGLIAARWGMVEPLRAWVQSGKPTWGTCAGMIMLAERATNQKKGGQPLLGGLDVTVNRNYFGRQVNSFETTLETPGLDSPPCHAIFIRAPAITEISDAVESLAQLNGVHGEMQPVHVAVRQGMLLATAFHPELTPDPRWHKLFVEMVESYRRRQAATEA